MKISKRQLKRIIREETIRQARQSKTKRVPRRNPLGRSCFSTLKTEGRKVKKLSPRDLRRIIKEEKIRLIRISRRQR